MGGASLRKYLAPPIVGVAKLWLVEMLERTNNLLQLHDRSAGNPYKLIPRLLSVYVYKFMHFLTKTNLMTLKQIKRKICIDVLFIS